MRRIILALSTIFLALGLSVTAAGASTAPTPVAPATHVLPSVPGASSAAVVMCDNLNPKTCWNDPAGACGNYTHVIAWGYAHASNEDAYFINQGNGWYSIHFKSCGNNVCVYAANANGAGTFLYTCNGNNTEDLWNFTGNSPDQVYNAASRLYFTCSGQPNQCATDTYSGYPGQDWGFYQV